MALKVVKRVQDEMPSYAEELDLFFPGIRFDGDPIYAVTARENKSEYERLRRERLRVDPGSTPAEDKAS